MKKHRLFVTFLLILCMTNTWAQEFESIHKLISDTSVQAKVVPIGSISSAAEETNQILREIDQSLIPPDALINIDSALSLIQEKVDSIDGFVKDKYFNVEKKN